MDTFTWLFIFSLVQLLLLTAIYILRLPLIRLLCNHARKHHPERIEGILHLARHEQLINYAQFHILLEDYSLIDHTPEDRELLKQSEEDKHGI